VNPFAFWSALAAWSLRTGQPRIPAPSPTAAHLLLMERVKRAQAVAATEAAK
jgi:hypothetical protein